jgi:hypothetical protein
MLSGPERRLERDVMRRFGGRIVKIRLYIQGHIVRRQDFERNARKIASVQTRHPDSHDEPGAGRDLRRLLHRNDGYM